MSPRVAALEVAAMILLGALWIVFPGWALLLVGAAIGLLTVGAWAARKMGI